MLYDHNEIYTLPIEIRKKAEELREKGCVDTLMIEPCDCCGTKVSGVTLDAANDIVIIFVEDSEVRLSPANFWKLLQTMQMWEAGMMMFFQKKLAETEEIGLMGGIQGDA